MELEKSLIALGAARRPEDIVSPLSTYLSSFLSLLSPGHITVFALNPLSGKLASVGAVGRVGKESVMPGCGVLQEVFGKTSYSSNVTDVLEDDPIRLYLPFDSAPETAVLHCGCFHGIKEPSSVVAVFAALLDGANVESRPEPSSLALFTRMLAATLERVCRDAIYAHQKQQLDDLAREHLSPNKTISQLCKLLQECTFAEATAFFTRGESSNELHLQMWNGEIDQSGTVYPVDGSPYGLPVLDGKISLFTDKISRFPPEAVAVAEMTVPTSILCLPLLDSEKEVVAVLCALHCQDSRRFTQQHEEFAGWFVTHASPVFMFSSVLESERQAKLSNRDLLHVAESLFGHLDNMPALLGSLIKHAQKLTCADTCSVFMIERNDITNEQELVAVVFDNVPVRGKKGIRLPFDQGICGEAATTGKILNIRNAYEHPKFNKSVDAKTNYHTQNILCFPIRGKKGIVGVAQLCNKNKGHSNFTTVDEELAEAFSLYCAISIQHSMLLERAVSEQNRSRLAAELMLYHMQVPQTEVDKMMTLARVLQPDVEVGLNSFKYPLPGNPEKKLAAVFFMYEDMGLLRQWRIPKDVLCRFILMVRKGYRDTPYHNWDHAFLVAHFCYCLWKKCGYLTPLNDIEVLGLFVASLCHDIDHRGTNNKFQESSRSVLAYLYSSTGSVMERHHIQQTLCILNTEGCNIFSNLSTQEYHKVLEILQEVILDTDLAVHMRKVKQLEAMAEEGVDGKKSEHHSLLLSLLMTSCDLNSTTKSWQEVQIHAANIYEEFFSQGDMELAMEGKKTAEMFNRDSAIIPEQQISFCEVIALPVFKLLAAVYKETLPVLQRVERNLRNWKAIKEKYWKEGYQTPEQLVSADDEISVTDRTSSSSLETAADTPGISNTSANPSLPNSPMHKDDVGYPPRWIDVARRMHVRVHKVFFSARASRVVGADYTLQAARNQPARARSQVSFDILDPVSMLSARLGHAPTHVERVTDRFKAELASQMSPYIDPEKAAPQLCSGEDDSIFETEPASLAQQQDVSGDPNETVV